MPTDLMRVTHTLQGYQDKRWHDISTARNISYSKALEEKEDYEEVLARDPTIMRYTEFRIVRDERYIVYV